MTETSTTALVVPRTIYTTSPGRSLDSYHTRTNTNEDQAYNIMTPITNNLTSEHPLERTPSTEQQETYQELKWNHPLPGLEEKFDVPEVLGLEDGRILPVHAGRTALLVVDVQPEYWSQSPAVRQDFPEFPQRLQKLVAQSRKQKAKIIWVRADYRHAHSPWLAQFARLHQGRIPAEVHSDPKDDNLQWEDFATPEGGEYVIPKTSWSSTSNTALMDLLKQSGIDTVLVCGLITSVCVQHTAFGIFEAGYRTILVTDACADRGKARHDAALALYGDYMYELASVEDLCQQSNPFYLRPALPVWLTPHSAGSLVQPQFFNILQDWVVGGAYSNDHVEVKAAVSKNPELLTFYKAEDEQKMEEPTKVDEMVGKSTMNSTSSTSSLSTLSSATIAIEALGVRPANIRV